MKIKFIKEYRAIGDFGMPGKAIIARSTIGDTADNLDDEDAEWLINNGFAEEVKESGWWKPENGENYYFINLAGGIEYTKHEGRYSDEFSVSSGNCFKTYFAADKCRDYWEAVATVCQDEGVLTPGQAAKNGYIYYICVHNEFGLVVHGFNADYVSVNTVLFDTREHAQASRDKHLDEWKIIANYDWSRE